MKFHHYIFLSLSIFYILTPSAGYSQDADITKIGDDYYSKKIILFEDFDEVGPGWRTKSGILLKDGKLNLNQRSQNFLFEDLPFTETTNVQIRIRIKYNSYEPSELKHILHEIDWIGKEKNSMRHSQQGISMSNYTLRKKNNGIPSENYVTIDPNEIKTFKNIDLIFRKIGDSCSYIIDDREFSLDTEFDLSFNEVSTVIIHFSGCDALLDEIEIAQLEVAEKPKEEVRVSESEIFVPSPKINSVSSNKSSMLGMKFHALIVGNNAYKDPNLADLDQPILDATNLYNVLTTRYEFDPENVVFLKDATRRDIITALDALSNNLTENDNLLIFYAGHGHWDSKKESGYWLPVDAERDVTVDWLRNSTVQGYIENIESKHTLVIADACFGGGIFKTRAAFSDASKSINNLYRYSSRKAMTSGMLNEVPDKSVFMENLVERLEDNEEKYLPSMDLFMQFRENVMNNSYNAPQYGTIHNTGDKGGDFIFIRR